MHNLPVTVAILTRNSAKTLSRALESVRDFGEILIADGQSTDDTLAIAHRYGARSISQDKRFLADDGRITDFSGVRNQMLRAASYDWVFFLDADECSTPELALEMREKITQEPAAFWVPRKYMYRAEIIDCSVAYPSQQMRFFHRAVVQAFIKEVHERIELRPGVVPRWLTAYMLVPMPDTVEEMIAKWRNYLAIERMRRAPLTVRQWLSSTMREAGIALRFLFRLVRIALLCRGSRLPVSYERARVWYQWMLIRDSFAAITTRELYRALLFLAGVACVVFFSSYHLFNSPETWMDEGLIIQSAIGLLHTGKAALPVAPGVYETGWYITTGFPVTLPIAGVFALCGVSLEGARLVMLVFLLSFFSVLFCYSRRALEGSAAWFGFFLIVFFAPIYGNGRNVLGEIPGLLFVLLALIPLLHRGALTRKRALIVGAFAGLAVATKPIFVLFLPALLLAIFLHRKELALKNVSVFGVLGFAVPLAMWVFFQFDTVALSHVFAVYANPHDVSLGSAIAANARRLVTEMQPLYFAGALAVWWVSYGVRRMRGETIRLTEEALLFFSSLVLAAYMRTVGYYRYFFLGQIFVLHYLPQSLLSLTKTRGWLVKRGVVLCLSGLVLFQAYETAFHSWTAVHYDSLRTGSLEKYFDALPREEVTFAYQVPEVVPVAWGHALYQYAEITPSLRFGERNIPLVDSGTAPHIITSIDFYQSHAEDVFVQYRASRIIDNYVVLRPTASRN